MSAFTSTALAGSAVSIAVTQVCSGWLRRWCGARVAYACWLLPWLSVAASFLPDRVASAILSLPGGVVGRIAERLSGELPDGDAVAALWGAIAILCLGFHLALYRSFCRKASRHAIELQPIGGVRVFLCPNVFVPVAAGILYRRIFLPANFEQAFTPDEQRMILRHEQAHHERRDILANLFGLVLLSLHWWNPLAHVAHRRFRADQELACDATVIARLDRKARYAYGTAILKCMRQPRAGLAAAMSGRMDAATRLSAIALSSASRPSRTLLTMAAVAALGTFTLFDGAATCDLSSSSAALVSIAPSRLTPMPSTALLDDQKVDPREDAWVRSRTGFLFAQYHPHQTQHHGLIPAILRTGLPPNG